jgi:hypothetical protein
MPDHWNSQGYPQAEKGLISGAFVRIMTRQYVKAVVYKDGVYHMTIRSSPNGYPQAYFGKSVLGVVNHDGSIGSAIRARG